jgi:hypothetical protein
MGWDGMGWDGMGCQYQQNLKVWAREPCEMNQTDTGKAQGLFLVNMTPYLLAPHDGNSLTS